MNKKEKEILNEIAKELDIDSVIIDIDKFYRVQGLILTNISCKLPLDSEIKKFFQEIEYTLVVRKEIKEIKEVGNNIINENSVDIESIDIYIERVGKVIKIFQGVEKRFDAGQYPQGIPQQIIQAYQACLDYKIERLEVILGRFIVFVREAKEE